MSFTTKNSRTKFLIIGAIAVVLACAVAGILALSGDKPANEGTQPPAVTQEDSDVEIQITDNGFEPASVSIKPGTKVIWTNIDSDPHQVIANALPDQEVLSELKSEVLSSTQTYEFTFEKAGSFSYRDEQNPTSNGTIEVETASTAYVDPSVGIAAESTPPVTPDPAINNTPVASTAAQNPDVAGTSAATLGLDTEAGVASQTRSSNTLRIIGIVFSALALVVGLAVVRGLLESRSRAYDTNDGSTIPSSSSEPSLEERVRHLPDSKTPTPGEVVDPTDRDNPSA